MKENRTMKRDNRTANKFTVMTIILFLLIASPVLCIPLFLISSWPFCTRLVISCVMVLFIVTGFMLPYVKYRKMRRRQYLEDAYEEVKKWGYAGRLSDGPCIAHVEFPVVYKSKLLDGKRFYSEWFIIHDGVLIVNPGKSKLSGNKKSVKYDFNERKTYAWDGCTPKRYFWWLAILGTPDGKVITQPLYTIEKNRKNDLILKKTVKLWQRAFHASLVHDAMCQYIHHIPVEKKVADKLFYGMLRESGWGLCGAKVYKCMTSRFSPESKSNDYEKKGIRLDRDNAEMIMKFKPLIKKSHFKV